MKQFNREYFKQSEEIPSIKTSKFDAYFSSQNSKSRKSRNSRHKAGPSKNFVSQLFWPQFSEPQEESYIVGWNTNDFICIVVAFVPKSRASFQVLQDALRVLSEDPAMKSIFQFCSPKKHFPIALGEWIPTERSHQTAPPTHAQDAPIWLSIGKQSSLSKSSTQAATKLLSLYCCGCAYRTTCYLITYPCFESHKSLRYVTPQPPSGTGTSKGCRVSPLDCTLRQINSAGVLRERLDVALAEVLRPKGGHEGDLAAGISRQSFAASRTIQPPAGASSGNDTSSSFLLQLWSAATARLAWLLTAHIKTSGLGEAGAGCCLGDLSVTCMHLAVRAHWASQLPGQQQELAESTAAPVEEKAQLHLLVTGRLVHAAGDLIAGFLCVFILEWVIGTQKLFQLLSTTGHLLHVEVLRKEIIWLNFFPAGFKLNPPLTHKLGSAVLMVLDSYGKYAAGLKMMQPFIMRTLTMSGLFGITTFFAVALDVFRVVTLHISIIHFGFSKVQQLHSSLLVSFWHLFRGKKSNILRNRIDTRQYDATQLLLGTVAFTILFFLFPTVLVYYMFFVMVRILVLCVELVILTAYLIASEFPTFELLLYCTDTHRLPFGIEVTTPTPLNLEDEKRRQCSDSEHSSEQMKERDTNSGKLHTTINKTAGCAISKNSPGSLRLRVLGQHKRNKSDSTLSLAGQTLGEEGTGGMSTSPTLGDGLSPLSPTPFSGHNMFYIQIKGQGKPLSQIFSSYGKLIRQLLKEFPASELARVGLLGQSPKRGFMHVAKMVTRFG